MKRYKIISILVLILVLSWLVLPHIGNKIAEDYDRTQLKELKIMAKNNNEDALNNLIAYYTYKEDSENLLLVLCAAHKPAKGDPDKIVRISSSGKKASLKKECPNNPIDKIKDRDNFLGNIKHFLKF